MKSDSNHGIRFSSKWGIRIASIAAVLVGWQIIGSSVNTALFSTPILVASAFVDLSLHTTFPTDLAITIGEFALGYAIAAVLGISIGMAMGRWETIEVALDPYVNALYATPYVALAPLFVIWLGIGFYSLMAVVILSGVFIILLNTLAGVKNVSRSLVETGRVFGFSGVKLYTAVVIPGSLPYIITGLRLGIGRAFVGVIVAELLVRLVNLGYLMTYYSELLEVAPGLAIAVTLGLLGLALTEALKKVESSMSQWRTTAVGG